MQATTTGPNRTGGASDPDAIEAMIEATDALSPEMAIDMADMEAQKLLYMAEADAVGSVPPPATLKGSLKTGMAKLTGSHPAIFMDKLGERLAFERSGVRLYEALILKHRAAEQLQTDILPPMERDTQGELESDVALAAETAAETLERIRGEELQHFQMLTQAMQKMGGDPTAMTPCADVAAVASSGIMQVLNDPRTTLAQCLNAILTVELTDNAGWELLIALADDAGESELAGRFLGALSQEQEHLAIVKSWLTRIVAIEPEPAAV